MKTQESRLGAKKSSLREMVLMKLTRNFILPSARSSHKLRHCGRRSQCIKLKLRLAKLQRKLKLSFPESLKVSSIPTS